RPSRKSLSSDCWLAMPPKPPGCVGRSAFGRRYFDSLYFSERAADSDCSLPPCGGGLGRGGAESASPPPPTPPRKGEGNSASFASSPSSFSNCGSSPVIGEAP